MTDLTGLLGFGFAVPRQPVALSGRHAGLLGLGAAVMITGIVGEGPRLFWLP